MNRRDIAIMSWVKKQKPDAQSQIKNAFANDGLLAIIAIAFEAGRVFQAENPNVELNNPNVYL